MKDSDVTVTMSMTAYKELNSYKDKYSKLKSELIDCFNFNIMENSSIPFSVKKALDVCKRYLPIKYQNANIVVDVE